jgi:hypothetical protein
MSAEELGEATDTLLHGVTSLEAWAEVAIDLPNMTFLTFAGAGAKVGSSRHTDERGRY